MKRSALPLRAAPLRRVTRLRPVSKRRQAQSTARRAAETALGRDADGNGICAMCGRFGEVHGHERLGRAQGGDPTKPDCLLCNVCNGWIEDHPVEAARLGWKIRRGAA